jgi:hypothetical protein
LNVNVSEIQNKETHNLYYVDKLWYVNIMIKCLGKIDKIAFSKEQNEIKITKCVYVVKRKLIYVFLI